MKRLAVGCLIVLVLLGIAGGVATYFVYRAVKTTVIDPAASAYAELAALKTVPDLERQVRNASPFTPPASGVLTAAQVERLVAVQTKVRTHLGTGFSEIERRYKTLLEKEEATARDLPELIAAYRDVAKVWLSGKRAQVEALNDAGFSLAEYRWVRGQAYGAVGMPVGTLDIARLIEESTSGRESVESPVTWEGSVGPSGPPENQRLIEGVKKILEENAALAIFGL